MAQKFFEKHGKPGCYLVGVCIGIMKRFGRQKNPLEELKDLKQEGDLETYI